MSSLNGIGGSLGKHVPLLIKAYLPSLTGNYRTVTRLRIAADLLRALWPRIACGVISAVAAGTLIYVGSG